jgi:hypothetical protein
LSADHKLKPYCTDRQWQYLEVLAEHGSSRKAAAALGVDKAAVNRAVQAVKAKAAQHGYAPDHDMAHPVPDGFRVKRVSTLRDLQSGEAKIQWQISEPDKEQQAIAFKAAVEAMTTDVPRVKATKAPKTSSADLCAAYPVGDHHIGCLSWDKETGDNYDLAISEDILKHAMGHLVGIAPACEDALIPVLGDFMHYDSFKPMTPTSGNLLDADSRFPKMVSAAIRSLRYLIEVALMKHKRVHVIVEIGNHDLSSSIFMMQLLANVYENEPRVTIDTSPMHFHYYQFGANLIMTHHGHGVKLNDLPILMATDQPKMWGETRYRTCWTGHVHHTQVKDLVGATIESFAVLAPEDAWAHQKGYRPKRTMKSIIFHREFGEVARNTVNPEMLA